MTLSYKDSEIEGSALWRILQYLCSSLEVPVLLGISSALWFAVTRRTLIGILPLLLILAVSLAIALPGKNYPHYFIIVLPFLAIPNGIGLVNITRMSRGAAFLSLLVLFGFFIFSIWDNYKFYTVYSPDEVSMEKYISLTFVDSVKVARYLRENTRPDDYIFQWGFEPELYFLADRRCPNPYLVSILPSWSKDPQMVVNKMKQSLLYKKPAYVVLQPEWSDFEGEKEIGEYIVNNCRKDNHIGYADIYRCLSK